MYQQRVGIHCLKLSLKPPLRCCQVIATLSALQVALGLALLSLPPTFSLPAPSHTPGQEYDYKQVKNWYMFVCVSCGLWGGLAIGLQTEYFTSNRYKPVQVIEVLLRSCCSVLPMALYWLNNRNQEVAGMFSKS